MTPQKLVYSSKSWDDFVSKIKDLPVKARGTAFEWFCKFYLLSSPKYRLYYDKVWHFSEFVKDGKHQRKLRLPDPEQGTDLVALRKDGGYEIIQCKFKDNINKNIVLDDINSSLTTASYSPTTKYVDTVLMCSNLQGLTQNKDLLKHPKTVHSIHGGVFESLTDEDFKNIRKAVKDQIPVYKARKPLPHQKKAITESLKRFKKETRGKLIHACGTGKTLTSYYLYQEMKPGLTLFLVPSLQLINQTLTEWCLESLANKKPISPFIVCSDETNERVPENDPNLWLQELGIKVSTKTADIKAFVDSKRPRKVIFSTYKSSPELGKTLKKLKITPNFAFFDEAHNTVNKETNGYLLLDKNLPIKKRLFLTATPRTVIGHYDKYVSMDDELVYGDVFDEITVKDAIEEIGMLNDYKIITQLIDNTYVESLLKENPFVYDKKKLPKETELKMIASALTLEKTIKRNKVKNIVSFHGAVKRAKAFQNGINNLLDKKINTYHVNGTQSGTHRKRILDDFSSSSPSLVTNAQCLSEGVNVPSIDAVIFVDPKQSRVSITQAVGRALRKPRDGNKGKSYIIIPVAINTNDQEDIDEKYQEILMVLRALAEHDGRLVDYFRLKAKGKKPKSAPIDIPTEYLPEELNLEDFIKELDIKAWKKTSKLGRRPFEQAREYVRTLNLQSEKEWYQYKEQNPQDVPDIPKDVYRAYKNQWISWFDFLGTKSPDDNFNQFILEYKEYLKTSGSDIFPNDDFITPSGFNLGGFIAQYKWAYKQKTLKKSYISKINKSFPGINFWVEKSRHLWEIRFKAYKDYLKKYNKTPSKQTVHNNVAIGVFRTECKRRYHYGGKKYGLKKLEHYQIKLLRSINFDFSYGVYESKWNANLKKLKQLFKTTKGKIPKEEKALTRWAQMQKTAYKNNTLSKEKIEKLNAVKYWKWDVFESRLDKNIDILLEFVAKTKNNNPKVYQKIKFRNLDMGRLIRDIREKYDAGILSSKQIKKLKKTIALDPVRDTGRYKYYDDDYLHEKQYLGINEKIKILRDFIKYTGNKNPARSSKIIFQERDMGHLLYSIREKYQQGFIDKKQLSVLEKMGVKVKPQKIIKGRKYY